MKTLGENKGSITHNTKAKTVVFHYGILMAVMERLFEVRKNMLSEKL
jgi:hypothetical protein